jgi:CrcB protein
MRILYFILGAGVGTSLRFLIVNHFKSWTEFPAGVLTVNVLGSFILGLTSSMSSDSAYLSFGFCGAFTTWSSLMLEINNDLNQGKKNSALWHTISTFTLGLLAAWIGIKLRA